MHADISNFLEIFVYLEFVIRNSQKEGIILEYLERLFDKFNPISFRKSCTAASALTNLTKEPP